MSPLQYSTVERVSGEGLWEGGGGGVGGVGGVGGSGWRD